MSSGNIISGGSRHAGDDAEDRFMTGRSSLPETSANSTALLEAYIPGLRRFACALLRGDREHADDLVQDSLERALANWHRRRSDADLRSWIYTIVYNRFLTEWRRQRRYARVSSLSECLDEDLPRVDGGQASALTHRDLLRAFAELPQEQRAVLLLVGVDDFSYKDAARLLGVPIGTVMSRLSRGRERLREYMDGGPVAPVVDSLHSHDAKAVALPSQVRHQGLTHQMASAI
jgi:RNA polymerase sigma-70 factor, ECF subfamily